MHRVPSYQFKWSESLRRHSGGVAWWKLSVIERRLRGSLGIGAARNEVEMGRSSASAGDGSETLSDKDFPGSVFSHGVFVIRNGAFFSSALPQLEI